MHQLLRKKIYAFDIDNTLVDWSSIQILLHDLSYSIQMLKAQKSLTQQRGQRGGMRITLPDCSPLPIDPDMLAFLRHLQDQREIVVILSDLPHRELHALFAELDIQLIVNGQDIYSTKPLPDGIWQIASQYGTSPCEIFLIGDQHKSDFRAAVNAGAQYCSVEELKQIGWKEFYRRTT